jgi:hypothetical protein
MRSRKSDPPRLAIWLSRHARPGGDKDALTGDLIERFREGQTRGWFWSQVLIALAASILGGIRRHSPSFCYAIAGTGMPYFFWSTADRSTKAIMHWHVFHWPWSMLVRELGPPAMLAWAVLPVLAVALAANGTFRWIGVFRTGVITAALIGLGHFTPDAFPWLLRPVEGSHHQLYDFIFPHFFLKWLFFSSFLASAWVGCLPARPAKTDGQAAVRQIA